MSSDSQPSTPASGRVRGALFSQHPPGLRALFFAELWERFSYYGMRALLVLFLVAPVAQGGLGLATQEAARIYGNYTMAVYMLAIPGGFVADALIGPRRAVLIGGLIIAAGHFTLAVPGSGTLYAGLILIALGTGFFKPNISALVGRLYEAGDPRRDSGFSLFYLGINVGAFVAPILTGFLAQSATFQSWLAQAGIDPNLSWHFGFGAAGVGMVLGLIAFIRHRGIAELGAEPPVNRRAVIMRGAQILLGTLALMALIILSDRAGLQWLKYAFVILPLAAIVYFAISSDIDRRRIAAIIVLFIAAMLFFAVFEQMGLSIALFADQLTRNEVFGLSFPSAWFQSLNALFVIALAPLFSLLWLRLGDRQPSIPAKFALGLVFVAISFLIMVPAAKLTLEGKVSPLWLVALFFLQTVGELLLSPVGLSAMTKLAPVRMVGLMLGFWFLATAFGNKLAGLLGGEFQSSDPAALSDFFLHQALLLAIAALVLTALVPWVKRLMGDVR